ncbi:hypothetical protein CRG98_001367 [Punica granatum]|uniref:Uncharacterized protein n=1 Tax=Punica granatum TaxID=22663 RepID=A0A2I0LDA5_PUNGR|nr:hypothetical protein CRG98_001367 [Punica granatum]
MAVDESPNCHTRRVVLVPSPMRCLVIRDPSIKVYGTPIALKILMMDLAIHQVKGRRNVSLDGALGSDIVTPTIALHQLMR